MANLAEAISTQAMPVRKSVKTQPVLYVGCHVAERAAVEHELQSGSLSTYWADSAKAVIGQLDRQPMPIVVDLSRGAALLQLVREVRLERPEALMIGVVDEARSELTTEAVLLGMADVLVRPLAGARLAETIQRELAYGTPSFGTAEAGSVELYSRSTTMQTVAGLVAQAASRRGGVLVRGEDGTGRQVVARAIHAADPTTRARRFVVVDCAAHDAEALGQELFGVPARPDEDNLPARSLETISCQSRLYDALGGTLYLQNLAEAPTRVQMRLARLLRDREATIAEGNTTMPFTIRCIAGADRTADDDVREGRIRDDLFRRVSNIRIDTPSLRERREDLPFVANQVLRQVCSARQIPAKVLSRSALSLLLALPWRGHANELRTVLELAVSATPHTAVRLEAVLAHVRLEGRGEVVGGGTLRQARARFEREYISTILEQHRGRITDAAKVLGIQRTNLYRKMRSLSVVRERRA